MNIKRACSTLEPAFLGALLLTALAACSGEALDCSMGAMRSDCAPDTAGFSRLVGAQQTIQRRCLANGLQPETNAYAQCLVDQDDMSHVHVPLKPVAVDVVK